MCVLPYHVVIVVVVSCVLIESRRDNFVVRSIALMTKKDLVHPSCEYCNNILILLPESL